MATLLPNGVQQFFDAVGNPLASGTVGFYVPGTLVPKDTWMDASAEILNTNPIVLNAAGEAIIYGSGVYRQIVKDANGNLIWDQLTADTASGGVAWGGVSEGTANAQTTVATSFSAQDGQQLSFIAGLTNTGQMTLNDIAVLQDTFEGPTPLTGGEVVEGNEVTVVYESARGAFHLQPIAPEAWPVSRGGTGATDGAGAATNLGLVPNTRQVIAGNGMTGGGSLAADRTLTMGTPSSITNSTTNSVSATSHGHALGFIAAEVYTGTSASATDFPLGHVLLVDTQSLNAANSSVTFFLSSNTDYPYSTTGDGAQIAGTWRVRGRTPSGGGHFSMLCQKVA